MAKTVTVQLEGGGKSAKYLRELALRLGKGGEARVGFLEGATYPAGIERKRKDGHKTAGKNAAARDKKASSTTVSVAQVAFWNEYGTQGKRPSPPRPFFRNMIEDQMPTWAHKLGVAIPFSGYRSKQALEIVAADIRGHLIESINLLQDPPLAQYTIEMKGFAEPLIDTAVMLRATDWVVKMGAPTRD
jgi:hypothetical protein